MKHHLNTLFVMTDGAYLRKDGQAVVVRVEKENKLRVPLHNLGGIVCFGKIGCSPQLMAACGQQGVTISFLTEYGGFRAAVVGFTSGNVLLRREQYRQADDHAASCSIARTMITAKIANSRAVLLRGARDIQDAAVAGRLQHAAKRLSFFAEEVVKSESLDRIRGLEGESASIYFGCFNDLIRNQKDTFVFKGRSRRPPLDRVNALMSFLYSMLTHDARSACEATGLDSAVGFLHRDRPGRPGLALDLIEEFRAFFVDRLVFSLINRRQIKVRDFEDSPGEAVSLTEAGRKKVLAAFQKRKQDTIIHPYLDEKTTVGLFIHLQARLLARHIRGDINAYPAYFWK
jgi:CRISPR-associated protein Cas1